MNSQTNWGREFKQKGRDLRLGSVPVDPSHKKRGSTSDRFQKMQYAVTTALTVAALDKKKGNKRTRLNSELQLFVTDCADKKKRFANISQSFLAIVDQCPNIPDELLEDDASLQSFRDATAYTQQELEDLRSQQKSLADAIAALEHKPEAHKAAENEGINIVQKIATLIGTKVFDEKKAPANTLSLTKNIHRLKKEIVLSTPIEETAFNKVIGSIPKLGFFERVQNRLCNVFLGRKSKVAQSRENLIKRITELHENITKVGGNARASLDELNNTLKKANKNIEKRIVEIQTLQDKFKREKESALADLRAAEQKTAELSALTPEKETRINENLKVSKENLDAIEAEISSMRLIEQRKKSVDMPVDAVQEEIDKTMAEMFGSEEDLVSNPLEINDESLDAEQQETDRILADIDSSLVGVQSAAVSTKSSARVSALSEKSKELKGSVADSYRTAEITHSSIKHFKAKASENHQGVVSLKKEVEALQPSRVSSVTLASKKQDIVELKEAAERQLGKQMENIAAANQSEADLEKKRVQTSDLLLECKKAHLASLIELSSQKMAHCDSLIAANRARLEDFREELVVEPTQANDSEFDLFPEIYATNLDKSGLSDEIKQSLKNSKAAHERALGLKKSYEDEMKKQQKAITDPDRSLWETAKETFASFIQSKPEEEIQNGTEIERIDAAIVSGKECLEGLENFHRSILAQNGNFEKIESKKEAFQQAYLEAKKEIAVLSTLVGLAGREEFRQKAVEKSLQSVVASANTATGADEESVLEVVASAVMSTVKSVVDPNPEVTPMMSEEDLAKEIRRDANENLKVVESLVAECEALSDEIASCRGQGYDKFKKGGGESRIHQLKEKATALMREMHSSSRKGELELSVVQTLVSTCSALQHAVHTALLNTLLATPAIDESADSRATKIQEAEMWAKQADELLSVQEEALGEDGYEAVSLHRLVKVQNWLELQRKNHEFLEQHPQSSEDKELILSEKALYQESTYLLNTTKEVLAQHEAAKETLCEYKEKIAQAKEHKVEAVAVEAKPAEVSATVGSKDSVSVGTPYGFFQSAAAQQTSEPRPGLVRRTLGKAMAVLSAVVMNTSAWLGSLVESGGAGFL